MIHNSIIPGDGGAVLSEPPKWKEGNLSTDFDVSRALAYGAGKFVALNYNSNIAAYSTDGINWTQTTLPVSGPWSSICYGAGKFVASRMGEYKSVIYSTDGITWTEATLPTWIDYFWHSLTYGNGMFILTSLRYKNKYHETYLYSKDGITWTKGKVSYDGVNSMVQYWTSVCYGGGKFVLFGVNAISSDGTRPVYYSTDGIIWHKGNLTFSGWWIKTCYGKGTFVALSNGINDGGVATNFLAYSTDGINWNQSTLPATIEWRDVCYGAGMFVAVGYKNDDGTNPNCMAYSTDGINWKLTYGTGAIRRESVIFGNGKFVVCTENAGNEYLEPTYKEPV